MKLVKLDGRHKAYKEHGHRWAFRWSSYDTKSVSQVEKIMRDLHGSPFQWNRDGSWSGNFGHAIRGSVYRPYWVSFKNEQDATVVLLKMDMNNV